VVLGVLFLGSAFPLMANAAPHVEAFTVDACSYPDVVTVDASQQVLTLNTTEIMTLIEEIVPLLLTLAIVGALFAAVGKISRNF
jgi:hypothetical protein